MKNLLAEIHKIIGPLAPDDLEQLRRSIKRDGVIVPVILRKGTREIIDGKHRISLAAEAGNPDYPTVELDVDDKEAARQAVVLNLARRHLTPDQKRRLVLLLSEAKFTQQEVAAVVGVTQGRVSQIINTNNAKPLTFNEDTQSYEGPEEAEPDLGEPLPPEPEPTVTDLRYKTGKKAIKRRTEDEKMEEELDKAIRRRERLICRLERRYGDGFCRGIQEAKKMCKRVYYLNAQRDFTPEGLKSLLHQVGAPEYVLANLDKLSDINLSLGSIDWYPKADSSEGWEKRPKLGGHVLYITDPEDEGMEAKELEQRLSGLLKKKETKQ